MSLYRGYFVPNGVDPTGLFDFPRIVELTPPEPDLPNETELELNAFHVNDSFNRRFNTSIDDGLTAITGLEIRLRNISLVLEEEIYTHWETSSRLDNLRIRVASECPCGIKVGIGFDFVGNTGGKKQQRLFHETPYALYPFDFKVGLGLDVSYERQITSWLSSNLTGRLSTVAVNTVEAQLEANLANLSWFRLDAFGGIGQHVHIPSYFENYYDNTPYPFGGLSAMVKIKGGFFEIKCIENFRGTGKNYGVFDLGYGWIF